MAGPVLSITNIESLVQGGSVWSVNMGDSKPDTRTRRKGHVRPPRPCQQALGSLGQTPADSTSRTLQTGLWELRPLAPCEQDVRL